MDLLQKGELLTKIKEALLKLKKNNHSEELHIPVEEEKMDGDWEQFTQHFDKVHTDFLLELKNTTPYSIQMSSNSAHI